MPLYSLLDVIKQENTAVVVMIGDEEHPNIELQFKRQNNARAANFPTRANQRAAGLIRKYLHSHNVATA